MARINTIREQDGKWEITGYRDKDFREVRVLLDGDMALKRIKTKLEEAKTEEELENEKKIGEAEAQATVIEQLAELTTTVAELQATIQELKKGA